MLEIDKLDGVWTLLNSPSDDDMDVTVVRRFPGRLGAPRAFVSLAVRVVGSLIREVAGRRS